jgi:ubiquinone/menaquinone biosynthesis C-methylase UbiE
MESRRDDALLRARSYDDVAEMYEHINAPLMFIEPARALVTCAALRPGDRVVDVGAGTGAVARAAIDAVRTANDVIALDPSVPMLLAARRAGVHHLVAGCLPDLPFREGSVDVVLSSFVMTHVDDPDASVRDMLRVLKPGGRVALSAWSPADDAYSAAWSGVGREFVADDVLGAAARRVLPGEARFSQRDGLADMLASNGFIDTRTETHTFTFELNVEQMIRTREACASGRALRTLLSDAQWSAYQGRVRDVLSAQFPDGIRYERRVFFATGRTRQAAPRHQLV